MPGLAGHAILSIPRTSLVNAMFGGAFFLYFVLGTSYMKAVGFTKAKSRSGKCLRQSRMSWSVCLSRSVGIQAHIPG